MDATTVKAREYLRVSQDHSGRERSPEEQHDDLARDAQTQGWTLVEPAFRDVGSASKYQAKARAGFDRLVTDLAAGKFGASIMAIWEPRRGSRKVSEWLTLIETCEEQNVSIWVHTHARLYNPSNARDRRTLLEDAVDGEYDAATRSEAIVRALTANLATGRPHGIPPYGYRRDYTVVAGRAKMDRQVPDPHEAPVVAELFERYEAGHAISAIASDFAARGILTRSGRPWTPQHLRDLLRTAAYGGWRVHHGERTEADWPALVDRRQWLAVQRILDERKRGSARPGGAKHLLSLIALCDVCGGPLRVSAAGKAEQYTCRDHGHVLVDKAELDTLVWDAVVAYLSDRRNYAGFLEVADDGELDRVATELAEARADQDALADLSPRLAAKMEPPVLARIAELVAREEELRTPSRLSALLPPGPNIETRLAAAPLSAQRTVMRMVLVPEHLGEVRVQRSPEWPRRVPVGRRVFWNRDR